MREIKFRAWDKNSKQFVALSTEFFTGDDGIGEIMPPENIELMQFTGLKDKNGKEIYCSDIVKGTFDVDSVEDYVYLSLTEEDQNNGYKLFTIPDDIIEFARMALPNDLEVIGNIYENKELLK